MATPSRLLQTEGVSVLSSRLSCASEGFSLHSFDMGLLDSLSDTGFRFSLCFVFFFVWVYHVIDYPSTDLVIGISPFVASISHVQL